MVGTGIRVVRDDLTPEELRILEAIGLHPGQKVWQDGKRPARMGLGPWLTIRETYSDGEYQRPQGREIPNVPERYFVPRA